MTQNEPRQLSQTGRFADLLSESRASLENVVISSICMIFRGWKRAAERSCWPCLPGNFFPPGRRSKDSI